ncbi:TetR/AcrR family transcriptional regulator [Virgibacillus sp. AGTR]|uniref:TetR/AcrR family transcriptional regulator n=1 Tax=Virgibacillus salarius TaxID=447199 RepID=A0A941I9Y3_9BACI|nr:MULTISPECIES: TetR/AcrR family transcriptional regulator [Bacillaceae]NAZ08764.1 TetR family transcriptional regulator [Agaribacter marinus]MBR7796053.1 TetR/AcrR family transcriptional regulator [Virgibacillus salarius]MCC2252291.1 TetR/AcrR family transcriptional regulator [Virgibacillus sp. AGTR]MDY7045249.1 TetR/AcrR family transcriptional regulator [Virgibacillus sp. M23]QRZ18245.1 TetR/AcrR family transcriptional regulator [Virgibacillus sp. AGTR]
MRKGQKTRQMIVEQSRKLFAEKGYDMTKTMHIADQCGVSEATIYKYFNSKLDLLMETISHEKLEIPESSSLHHKRTEELLELYVRQLTRAVLTNFEQYAILFRETPLHEEISKKYVQYTYEQNEVSKELQVRINNGDLSGVCDFELLNVGIISSIIAMSTHHRIHKGKQTSLFDEQKIEQFVDFILHGALRS